MGGMRVKAPRRWGVGVPRSGVQGWGESAECAGARERSRISATWFLFDQNNMESDLKKKSAIGIFRKNPSIQYSYINHN